jgi:hypothetical protein
VSERLLRRASQLLERRVSRRRLLARAATAASALAVAPLRYLVRPGDALSTITCSNCGGASLCCDGYTVFCCTLTGVNACPPNTYLGGWWKCTSYTGTGPCSGEGVRYYMDCNALPGTPCGAGCHCANDACTNRSTCCNVFRYGQCHTEISQTTAIACRLITCVNPCTIYDACDCTYKEDDTTCAQDEGALCL